MARPVTEPVRPTYRTVVVECPVPRPRDAVWSSLLAHTGAPGGEVHRQVGGRTVVEEVCALEPPWRLVTRGAAIDGTRYAQVSVTLRDDGDWCLAVWCALVEPAGEPAGAGTEALLGDLRATLDAEAAAVARRVG